MSRRTPFFKKHRPTGDRPAEVRSEAVVGVVVDNKDPQKLGRVKVKLPTIAEDSSHWATMNALGAGKDRGWFFLPEIDDEVLVMFAHGEMNRPVIVGAIWNGTDKPPEQNGGGNERRVIVSRSGHRVEFDDDAGTITFEDGEGIGVATIAADGITIKANEGDFQSQSPKGQTNVKAASVTIEAKSDLSIKSGKAMNISAGGAMKIAGGGKLSLSGSRIDLNPGGTPGAASADGSSEDEPDKYG